MSKKTLWSKWAHTEPARNYDEATDEEILAQPCVVEALERMNDDAFRRGMAAQKALLPNAGHLSFEQIEVALRNLGHDPTCGACMEVFYTGASLSRHTCPEGDEHTVVVTTEPS